MECIGKMLHLDKNTVKSCAEKILNMLQLRQNREASVNGKTEGRGGKGSCGEQSGTICLYDYVKLTS